MGRDSISLVNASAGSGKTYRLTLTYLARLYTAFQGADKQAFSPGNIPKTLGSILAITFTNKAASEMQTRITGALRNFAMNSKGHTPLTEADEKLLAQLSEMTGIEARSLLKESEHLLAAIAVHFGHFNVMTIDSLMSAVVRVIAPELALPPDFQIRLDSAAYVSEHAVEYINSLCENNWPAVKEFLKSLLQLEQLKTWRVEDSIRSFLEQLFMLSLNQPLSSGKESGSDGTLRGLQESAACLKKKLSEFCGFLYTDVQNGQLDPQLNARVVSPDLVREIEDYVRSNQLTGKLSALLKRAAFQKDSSAALFKKSAPQEVSGRLEEPYALLKNEFARYVEAESLFRVRTVQDFFSDFVNFCALNRKDLLVSEFAKILRQQLEKWEHLGMPYLYLKLAERFVHFLFDEFQDTSELQFKALAPLIDDSLSGDERTSLFLVGDKKQAIYRWRGGNTDLMNETRLRQELSALSLIRPEGFTRTLQTNWRSCREIVDFNSEFWSPENLIQTMENPLAAKAVKENFLNSSQAGPPGSETRPGMVRITLTAPGKQEIFSDALGEEELFKQITGIIGECDKLGFARGDIAVLVRKRKHGRQLLRRFSDSGIPAVSDESLLLDSSKLINHIVVFFRFLEFPPDNLSFYSFVNSDMFLQAVEKQFPEEAEQLTEDFFVFQDSQKSAYTFFREKFPRSWAALIQPFFARIGFLPAYDMFQDITSVFNLYGAFPGQNPFLLAFGQLLHACEQEGIVSVGGFLKKWQEIVDRGSQPAVEMSESPDMVKVLTLHKAKGLEFPVAIVPVRDERDPGPGNLYFFHNHLYQIDSSRAAVSPKLAGIYNRERIQGTIDELNLYYVGFTRPRQALFVPVLQKKPLRKSSIKKSGSAIIQQKKISGIILDHPVLKQSVEALMDSPQRIDSLVLFSRGSAAKTETVKSFSPEKEKTLNLKSKTVLTGIWQGSYLVFSGAEKKSSAGLERGKVFHRIMAEISLFSDKKEIRPRVRSVLEKLREDRKMEDWICSFIENPRIFPYFSKKWQVWPEQEIVTENPAEPVLRIDRLLESKEKIVVVEFKTGSAIKKEHFQQVKAYMKLVAGVEKKRRVSGVILYPDLGTARELT